jgi:phosphatidylglycerol:prolipoprotein diacylglycerol transferase
MLPRLFEIGPFEFHTYGLMLAIAFVVGIQLALAEGRRRGLDDWRLGTLALWILVWSIAGSRLVYVLTHLDSYRGGRWLEALAIWEGGLTMYGGLLAALVGSVLLVRHWRLPLGSVFDAFAPSVALGEGITRIGCFLNGCCFGRPCDLPWAVSFPSHSHAGATYGPTPLHPTQLYLSAAGLAIFAILWLLRRRIVTPGRLFWVFLLLQCVARFTIDFFRYFEPGGETVSLAGLTLSLTQVWCLVLAFIALLGLVRRPPAPTSEPVTPAGGELG